MKIKRNIIIIIILSVMILLVSTFLVVFSKKEYSSSTSKNEIPSYIAIYLEDSVGSGTYTYSDLTSWPDLNSYTYNKTKSTCKNGTLLLHNIVDNSVEAKLLGSDSCNVYYDATTSLSNYVKSLNNIEQEGDDWIVRKYNDSYHYAGTNPHNYVCFGTTNKDDCLNDTDTYLYRIISVESVGQDTTESLTNSPEPTTFNYSAKIVSTKYQDATSRSHLYYYKDNLCNDLNSNTEGNFYYELNDIQKNLIINAYWYFGRLFTVKNYTAQNAYELERTSGTTYTAYEYIGLPAVSDLGFSVYEGESYTGIRYDYKTTTYNTYLENMNSYNAATYYEEGYGQWLATGTKELTISANTNLHPYVYTTTKTVDEDSDNLAAYRPTMYLNSDVQITSGTGTADDPFIINRPSSVTTKDVVEKKMVRETDLNAYMYEGLKVNNYACFGTTDKEECTTAVDAKNYTKYLYRIVGYFPTEYATNGVTVDGYDYLFKLQKQDRYYNESGTAITYAFDTGGSSYYPNSTLYNELNVIFLNQYAEEWQNHIANAKWYLGTVSNSDVTADLYAKEHGTNSEVNTFICKAALLYPSDVIYSVPSSKYDRTASILNTSTSSAFCPSSTSTDYDKCNTYLMKATSTTEFLLNPSDYNVNETYDSNTNSCTQAESCVNRLVNRHIKGFYSTFKTQVYPAIYLTADAYIVSGSGTADDPYIFGFNS